MTQVAVGDNVTNVDFSAIFDSGTSFTYVDDPAYSVITQNVSRILTPRLIIIIGMHSTLTRLVDFFLQFDSQVQEPRHQSDSGIPFEYCYDLRSFPCLKKHFFPFPSSLLLCAFLEGILNPLFHTVQHRKVSRLRS